GLLASIFWDDATVVSGIVNGPGATFARDVVAYVTTHLAACFHAIGNEWIEINGDHGVGEHYVMSHTTAAGQESTTGGRYIDRYERRAGVWKIASRTFVQDWTATHPTTQQTDGLYAALTNHGQFGPADPVYAHWANA
ncbi:MAG: nuclear transport factor 2 family protein, partial [Sphingopyxis sp.]